MITVRRSHERGHANHGWLDTHHTFSFADYHDPEHMGFRSLRVINEDRISPGQGFGTHGHRDMEILSYVIEGGLEHKDSMGNGSIIRPGEVQYMSAGSGVTHSEFNPFPDKPGHFLQIWILPREKGAPPRYAQKAFPAEARRNRLVLAASSDGAEGSIAIRQDARLSLSLLDGDKRLEVPIADGRHAWIQMVKGKLNVNGTELSQGDGAAVSDERLLHCVAGSDGAEVLFFDLV